VHKDSPSNIRKMNPAGLFEVTVVPLHIISTMSDQRIILKFS